MEIDQVIRTVRYHFFRLSAEERFFLLVSHHLITKETIELLPLEFFKKGFESAIIDGGIDGLYDFFKQTGKIKTEDKL